MELSPHGKYCEAPVFSYADRGFIVIAFSFRILYTLIPPVCGWAVFYCPKPRLHCQTGASLFSLLLHSPTHRMPLRPCRRLGQAAPAYLMLTRRCLLPAPLQGPPPWLTGLPLRRTRPGTRWRLGDWHETRLETEGPSHRSQGRVDAYSRHYRRPLRVLRSQEQRRQGFRVMERSLLLHVCRFLDHEERMERATMVQHPSRHCQDVPCRRVERGL